MADFERARALLREFKGDSYLFGTDVLSQVGAVVSAVGKNAVLVRGTFSGSDDHVGAIRKSLAESGVDLVAEITGARPNSPREDVSRITAGLRASEADVVVSFGGGSTIDAVKAAEVLRTLGGEIDAYFGAGLVTEALQEANKALTTHVAIQTVASSAAHLTKYSNITDIATGQKKLIVDEAIVPACPV
ncbi:MAG: iron-containing alcohol dehydrogenase, partial [Phycisphaerales bacterium]